MEHRKLITSVLFGAILIVGLQVYFHAGGTSSPETIDRFSFITMYGASTIYSVRSIVKARAA